MPPVPPPSARTPYPGHYTPRRPWAPLTDAEWTALVPYVGDHLLHAPRAPAHTPNRRPPGRPLSCDPRARFEAMLHAAATGTPWRHLADTDGPGTGNTAAAGRGATVARHFRRLAHAGLWTRLLEAVADPKAPPALRAMEYWICRLARRAMRTLGHGALFLARRLGLLTALPFPHVLMPDRDLSALLHRIAVEHVRNVPEVMPPPGLLRALLRAMRHAEGPPLGSTRFAPPP